MNHLRAHITLTRALKTVAGDPIHLLKISKDRLSGPPETFLSAPGDHEKGGTSSVGDHESSLDRVNDS